MKKINTQDLIDFLKKNDASIEICGNTDISIHGISTLENYRPGSLTWIKNAEAAVGRDDFVFSAVILPPDLDIKAELYIISCNPKYLFSKALEYMDDSESESVIQDTAIISKSARLADRVSVGHYSVIGDQVVIGEGTVVEHHVVIGNGTVIGKNCHIKSGAVIGERGFGYSKTDTEYAPVPHLGRVVIGDYVDIGNNTCIDRGTLDDTVIQDGVKIDNLCHIAHNVKIERNCMVVANSSVGGSVHIEEGAYIALCATILNLKTIGQNSIVGMSAVVTRDIPPESVCAFSPARVIRQRTEEDRKKY